MAAALEKIARMASDGQLGLATFPYHRLTFAHVAAIRAKLAEAQRLTGRKSVHFDA